MNTIKLLNWADESLDSAGVSSAMCESEAMLAHVLNVSRLDLYTRDIVPDVVQGLEFETIVKERAKRTPLQYLLGNANFMGFDFKVKPGVFIPRPETELLVEEALKLLKFEPDIRSVLDLCSGSGNISISLTKSVSNCRMLAIDISRDAIETARENAEFHGVRERIEFYQGDMFSALKSIVPNDDAHVEPLRDPEAMPCRETSFGKMDMIISNPPYIPAGFLSDLPIEVRSEPRVAIDGGERGLKLYRRIISECPPYLRNGGWLLMEMGDGQADDIKILLQESRVFNVRDVVRDYNDKDRIIIARKRHG